MHTAPRSDEGARRIEVNRILNDDGTSSVLLQDMSYGPGVGWYAQKTIRLDDLQVSALLRKLCCTRERERSRRVASTDEAKGAARLGPPCIRSQGSTGGYSAPDELVRPGEIIHLDWRR